MSATQTSARLATVRLGAGKNARLKLRGIQLELLEAARTVRFTAPSVKIGKDEACDLVLEDPAASRTHLVIEDTPEGYRVRDLDSTNGTQVNGLRIREAYLTPGCIITIGATRLRFEPSDHEVPVTPLQEPRYHGLVGASPAMQELYGHLELVARTTLSVLLLGETGCGKEVVARALHEASPRAKGPFTVFDCGSVDRELVGAALFGHREGAFTGAAGARKGAFQSAHGGTLFLDEIGELPLDLQPRLLRVLERREVQPLGSDQILPVDVRVVAATHRDPEAMVEAGQFRQDLLFRLSGLAMELPTLRDRRTDVVPLAQHFLEQVRPGAQLEPAAAAVLEAHPWPGNVRELRHVVERAAALARSDAIGAADIRFGPVKIGRGAEPAPEPADPSKALTLQEAELAAVKHALKVAAGNKSQAARILGIARKTLREKMERFGLGGGDADE